MWASHTAAAVRVNAHTAKPGSHHQDWFALTQKMVNPGDDCAHCGKSLVPDALAAEKDTTNGMGNPPMPTLSSKTSSRNPEHLTEDAKAAIIQEAHSRLNDLQRGAAVNGHDAVPMNYGGNVKLTCKNCGSSTLMKHTTSGFKTEGDCHTKACESNPNAAAKPKGNTRPYGPGDDVQFSLSSLVQHFAEHVDVGGGEASVEESLRDRVCRRRRAPFLV